MKKIIFLLVGCICLVSSCSDFLDRSPLDKIDSKAYFKTANDIKLYVNQFYTSLPGYGGYDAAMVWRDDNSDNMIHETYNTRLAGLGVVPAKASDAGWNWDNIRAVNYMFGHIENIETSLESYSQYIGEAYFFRAYFYFDLLQKFGDLPWVDKAYAVDSPELYGERVSRSIIAENIIADLDKAVSMLKPKKDVEKCRIVKEVALLFKSRVALYEGTWEKYHNGTIFGVENSDYKKNLQSAVDAIDLLMAMNSSILYSTGDTETSYYELFNKDNYADISEVLLWREYSIDLGLTHRAQDYILYRGARRGLTKDLINDYLFMDGKPTASHPSFSDKTLLEEAEGRDSRLKQTIFLPGDLRVAGSELSYFEKPFIDLSGDHKNETGYQIKKGANPYVIDKNRSLTGAILFRYAEALLNYAEAKAELGTLTQNDLDKSINLLRERVRMPQLTMGNIVNDPNWKYKSVSPILNEIRRERRIELIGEGFRLADLLRWRAHETFVNTRPRGMYFNQSDFPDLKAGENILIDKEGYIDTYQKSLFEGYKFNPNRDYLLPLPTLELTLNDKLKPNPGW